MAGYRPSAVANKKKMRLGDELGISDLSPAVRPGVRPLSVALGIFRLHPRGGREGLCLQIASLLEARGHDVRIMVAEETPGLPKGVVRVVHPALVSYKPERIRMFAYAFRWATRQGFDRSVAFHAVPADLALLVDNIFDNGELSFLTRIGPRYRAFVGREKACMGRRSRTRVMGLSEAQMEPFISRYRMDRERVEILPPTVDPSCRRPRSLSDAQRAVLRAELGVPGEAPVWLWIGLQPMVKGLDRVLDVLARTPAARLLVCGLAADDKRMQPILRQAGELGVAERMRCLGFVPNESERFHDVLAAADVLVHPARNDTTGTVILEAVVNGLPAAVSSVCGYGEHVRRSGAGAVLAGAFDAEAWHAALAAIVPNRAALSAKGLKYGEDPALYSGVARAVELIEAPLDRPWQAGAEAA
jgi:UDP-glucose:(heptosyl)LPS alpha-1,3-glucosyltransferase